VTFWFVFNNKILTLATGELRGARLFGIEMVEARLARNNLPVFGKFQSFAI